MDAIIVTEANIQGLIKAGYGYLVVSRESPGQFDAVVSIESASHETVRSQR